MREQLACQPFKARVLAVFDRVCDLVTPEGQVIALVTPDVGDGPLNIVVDTAPGTWFSDFMPASEHARGWDSAIEITADTPPAGYWPAPTGKRPPDNVQIDLSRADVWEPRPDWGALQERLDVITRRLPSLCEAAWRHAPAIGAGANPAPTHTMLPVKLLQEGWNGDLNQLRDGTAQLAGLGNGLTPAGDDFLCGVMLWAWLAHPTPAEFCRAIAETATPRTTTLSAAFLRSAAQGECHAAWHRLLAALASNSGPELEAATHQVLAHGATSGADTLAGFLALSPTPFVPTWRPAAFDAG